jgi:hypothetical protein
MSRIIYRLYKDILKKLKKKKTPWLWSASELFRFILISSSGTSTTLLL